MVKDYKRSLKKMVCEDAGFQPFRCVCNYIATRRDTLNKHQEKCSKYAYQQLSPLEKEAKLRIGPVTKPVKTKFAMVGHNPRGAGRKKNLIHQCDDCNIVFLSVRAKAKHKRGKKHKEQALANTESDLLTMLAPSKLKTNLKLQATS